MIELVEKTLDLITNELATSALVKSDMALIAEGRLRDRQHLVDKKKRNKVIMTQDYFCNTIANEIDRFSKAEDLHKLAQHYKVKYGI